jgi:hypothetical protein
MLKAVLRKGQIVPLEPLPAEWKDGQEICLEAVKPPEAGLDEADEWLKEMEEAAAAIPPDVDQALDESIRAIRQQAKLQFPKVALTG